MTKKTTSVRQTNILCYKNCNHFIATLKCSNYSQNSPHRKIYNSKILDKYRTIQIHAHRGMPTREQGRKDKTYHKED